MLDERDLLASRLLDEIDDLAAGYSDIDKLEFRRVALYLLASRCISWDTSKWQDIWIRRYSVNDTLSDDRMVQVLMELCGVSRNNVPVRAAAMPEFELILTIISKNFRGAPYDEYIYALDYIFYKLLNHDVAVEPRHTAIIAALSSGLKREMGLIDYLLYSGEVFLKDNSFNDSTDYFYSLKIPEWHDLVLLRLMVRDINPVILDGRINLGNTGLFGLIDNSPKFSFARTSLTMLGELLTQKKLPEKLLVIVDKNDRGGELNARQKIRETLRYDDLLEAVIDFTSYDPQGKPKRYSAWLLNKKKHFQDETLCLNVSHIPHTDSHISPIDAVAFASAVVDMWASPYKFRLGRHSATLRGPIREFFIRVFDGTYSDKPGMCKVVNSAVVLARSISVAAHLSEPVNQFSILGIKPVMDLLRRADERPFTAYVIGNNGAGKSFLLSELAGSLTERNIRSVGVSFGAHDRFTLLHSKFKYLGESRRQGGAASQRTLTMLKHIAWDLSLAHVLEKALALLHFRHQIYLVPTDIPDEMLRTQENARFVIKLSHDNKTQIIRESKGRAFEPALLREGSSEIVRFRELSSGERHVFLMLAKIVYSAKPDTVILIDEPEISLHVHWQQVLPQLFSELSKMLSCSFVIATHSPTLVANVRDNQSVCFLARDGFLTPIPPAQRQSVETILMEGFEIYTPHNREVHERCAALVSDAIRITNGPDQNVGQKRRGMLSELSGITRVIKASGNRQDERYIDDRKLVVRAAQAIKEVYALAEKELAE
jgi:ABC-type cobalamin/Fe3+-siderophores transport system ATPase subunit